LSEPVAPRPIAVVGGGSIGVSWCLVFARAGHAVTLHDADPVRLEAAPGELRGKLAPLAAAGLLGEDVEAIAGRVGFEVELPAAVAGAAYVQECVPEHLGLKQELMATLEAHVGEECVLASSSSALMPSRIFAGLGRPERALVVHPANPPHLLPIVEVVPGDATAVAVVEGVEHLLLAAGMSPVRVEREVEGYVYNRLQGAVLREAYALVRDGVTDVEGIDRVMRDGLGRRWAVVGPFETSDLNTRGGIAVHAGRMGPAYARMGAERGQDDPWTDDLVASVAAQRRAMLPLECWEERVAWRDAQLVAQEQARRKSS
jgi:L-gulonate 3-dehydrogenase